MPWVRSEILDERAVSRRPEDLENLRTGVFGCRGGVTAESGGNAQAIALLSLDHQEEQLLTTPGTGATAQDWSPDGRTILGRCAADTRALSRLCLFSVVRIESRAESFDVRIEIVLIEDLIQSGVKGCAALRGRSWVATHINACFPYRRRLRIAIGDSVVRPFDRVDLFRLDLADQNGPTCPCARICTSIAC
jgi:hypothetical protein